MPISVITVHLSKPGLPAIGCLQPTYEMARSKRSAFNTNAKHIFIYNEYFIIIMLGPSMDANASVTSAFRPCVSNGSDAVRCLPLLPACAFHLLAHYHSCFFCRGGGGGGGGVHCFNVLQAFFLDVAAHLLPLHLP